MSRAPLCRRTFRFTLPSAVCCVALAATRCGSGASSDTPPLDDAHRSADGSQGDVSADGGVLLDARGIDASAPNEAAVDDAVGPRVDGGSVVEPSSGPSILDCGAPASDGNRQHWVSPTGAAPWSSCVGSTALSGSAACSLSTANQSATPGDTVTLRGGTYGTSLQPSRSGTSTAGIVFRAAAGEDVRLTGMDVAINLTNRSYLTVDGLSADTVKYWVRLETSDHVCIFRGKFHGLTNNMPPNWPNGIIIHKSSHHNWIKGCTASDVGYAYNGDDKGGIYIGDWENPSDRSHYNLVEDNTFYHGGHHVLEVNGGYNVIRNNYFHNENWTPCTSSATGDRCGNRNIIVEDGSGTLAVRNVIEDNVVAYSGLPADDKTASALSLRTEGNIVRHNRFFHNDGPAVELYTGTGRPFNPNGCHIFHNVFFHNGYTALTMSGSDRRFNSGLLFENSGGGAATAIAGVSVRNNLFWDDNGASIVFYYTRADAQDFAGNFYQTMSSLGGTGTVPTELPGSNTRSAANPLFVRTTGAPDVNNPEQFSFHVNGSSPAINGGAFLTKTTGAGQGTTLAVTDAGFFTDGFGVVRGDRIQLEGQTQTARVLRVDYASHTLTLETALTWTAGQGVSLPYSGSAPDMGVYEQ